MEANKTLLAFSVHNNCKKWLSFEKSTSPDIIGCMNGIRVVLKKKLLHAFILINEYILINITFRK